MALPGSKTEERHIGQDGNEQGIVTEGGGQVEVQQAVDSALQAATWTLQARQDMERAAGENGTASGLHTKKTTAATATAAHTAHTGSRRGDGTERDVERIRIFITTMWGTTPPEGRSRPRSKDTQ